MKAKCVEKFVFEATLTYIRTWVGEMALAFRRASLYIANGCRSLQTDNHRQVLKSDRKRSMCICVWEGKSCQANIFPGFKLTQQKQNQHKSTFLSLQRHWIFYITDHLLVQWQQTQHSVDWSTNRWHSTKQILKILFLQVIGLSLLQITTIAGWARQLHYKCTYG